jgi:Mg2+ and Co2+ transporter CorA
MKVSSARYGGGMDITTLPSIDTTTLFIIIAVLILVCAGGMYGWGRWF